MFWLECIEAANCDYKQQPPQALVRFRKPTQRIFAAEGDGLMGPFARKYGKRAGSEARAFFYLSATSFGISVLLLLVGPG